MSEEFVSLLTLGEGAAVELVNDELQKVFENILDPNTAPTKAREVILKLTFKPDENRDIGRVDITAGSKLVGAKSVNTIVYFGNVKRMTLSPAHGKLRLECTNGKAFVLERDKFPTGARKAEKIKKNKAKKFDKVSSKIMEKVRAASANVVLIGA